uniref:Uncharacterized protein n=1 Tax=Rhipicephalus zambeziensis TaxID=60191 RepID=A0A224YAM1_9ACAR
MSMKYATPIQPENNVAGTAATYNKRKGKKKSSTLGKPPTSFACPYMPDKVRIPELTHFFYQHRVETRTFENSHMHSAETTRRQKPFGEVILPSILYQANAALTFIIVITIIWTLSRGFCRRRRRHVPCKVQIDNIPRQIVCSTRG